MSNYKIVSFTAFSFAFLALSFQVKAETLTGAEWRTLLDQTKFVMERDMEHRKNTQSLGAFGEIAAKPAPKPSFVGKITFNRKAADTLNLESIYKTLVEHRSLSALTPSQIQLLRASLNIESRYASVELIKKAGFGVVAGGVAAGVLANEAFAANQNVKKAAVKAPHQHVVQYVDEVDSTLDGVESGH